MPDRPTSATMGALQRSWIQRFDLKHEAEGAQCSYWRFGCRHSIDFAQPFETKLDPPQAFAAGYAVLLDVAASADYFYVLVAAVPVVGAHAALSVVAADVGDLADAVVALPAYSAAAFVVETCSKIPAGSSCSFAAARC